MNQYYLSPRLHTVNLSDLCMYLIWMVGVSQMALYFSTGVVKDEPLFKHYALNVPFYTHFTSPIRRYADIIVHRLLASSLSVYLH